MSTRTTPQKFTKHYPNTDACRAALANYRWLTELRTPLRSPRLLGTGPRHLEFEFVTGRPAHPADVASLARHLGDVHGCAFVTTLHNARLDEPLATANGHHIPDFLTHRVQALRRRLERRMVPEPTFDPDQAVALLYHTSRGPAAIYKDSNPRNFLLTAVGTVTVDFDDVSLAPFGYDLAKLIVTVAMTHGTLSRDAAQRALSAYNAAARHHCPALCPIGMTELRDWAEIHHVLTSGYLGKHGYRYSWHTLRAALADPSGE